MFNLDSDSFGRTGTRGPICDVPRRLSHIPRNVVSAWAEPRWIVLEFADLAILMLNDQVRVPVNVRIYDRSEQL